MSLQKASQSTGDGAPKNGASKNYLSKNGSPKSGSPKDESALIFYRTPLAFLPEILIFLILVVGAIISSVAFPDTVQKVNLGIEISLSLAALFPLVFGSVLLHRLYNSRYTIAPESVRATHGILSFVREDSEIQVADIRGIEVHRNLYGRVLNVGSLEIGTAAHHGREIVIKHVYDPSHIRDLILDRKNKVLKNRLSALHDTEE